MDENDQLNRIRHSVAHVMAQAVLEKFPGGKLAIGPAIETGFYYDFDLPRPLTPDDLEEVEARMREIVAEGHDFVRQEVPEEEARRLFADEPYKLELIDTILSVGADEAARRERPGSESPEGEPGLSLYRHGPFVDLCRGPHVENTRQIDPEAVKLLNVAGAYWRGDSERPMLQRIYGTAWRTREELERFLQQREEAERRDHRRLGRELDLFHLDETAPGMPYWLPKGLKLLRELLNFWREEHEARGYQEISAPLINSKKLWEISGHWEHYKDGMFVIPLDERRIYGVKPMNCPNAMVVYKLKTRSYRDLPLRFSDCDILHRNELSGTLHGLLRVQSFRQDDSHNFVTENQIEQEYESILEIADRFYSVFGISHSLRLSTRPEDFIGDVETWERAEDALRRILDKRVGAGQYIIGEGEGTFYGPKIDIMMEDAIGRSWQMGSIQLDFHLPRRFDLTYVDEDGQERTPVVIHRVIYGSIERFVGILIEHLAGAFPLWIAPVQALLIPITDRHVPYAQEVGQQMRDAGLRVEIDHRRERMGAKIRDAQLQKVPYMLVVGDREQAEGAVAVRTRGGKDLGKVAVEPFIARCLESIGQRSLQLAEDF